MRHETKTTLTLLFALFAGLALANSGSWLPPQGRVTGQTDGNVTPKSPNQGPGTVTSPGSGNTRTLDASKARKARPLARSGRQPDAAPAATPQPTLQWWWVRADVPADRTLVVPLPDGSGTLTVELRGAKHASHVTVAAPIDEFGQLLAAPTIIQSPGR